MTADELKKRTKAFAVRILAVVDHLPPNTTGRVIANQLARCGTAVGANYRAACRSRSKAEFAAKMGVVVEEADESCYWLEIGVEAGLLKKEQVEAILDEANQLVAIMTASRKTACADLNHQSSISHHE